MAAEAEGVRHHGGGGQVAGLAGDDVDAQLGLGPLVIGRGRDQPVPHGQHGGHGLDRPGGGDQVPDDPLGRGDRQGVLTEHLDHGLGLGGVVQVGGGGVGVDVADVGGLQAGVGQGQAHAVGGAGASGGGGGHVVGVRVAAVAGDFAVDAGAPG